MIETGLLEAASRAVIEKEAAGLFSAQGIARAAGRGARKVSPAARAAAQRAEEFAAQGARGVKPTIIDAVSEPVADAAAEVAKKSPGHGVALRLGGGGGGLIPPGGGGLSAAGGGGLVPAGGGGALSNASKTPAQNNLLKWLGLGGAGVAGAGGTAYALSGGDDEAHPVPSPAAPVIGTPVVENGMLGMLNNMSPTARNALMGGAGGAIAGGLYGLMSPGEETVYDDMGRPTGTRRKSRLMSALRNAAVVGGLGAGAGGLYGAYRG
jgi:hypothetical protein